METAMKDQHILLSICNGSPHEQYNMFSTGLEYEILQISLNPTLLLDTSFSLRVDLGELRAENGSVTGTSTIGVAPACSPQLEIHIS